jgi:hypothetical protein
MRPLPTGLNSLARRAFGRALLLLGFVGLLLLPGCRPAPAPAPPPTGGAVPVVLTAEGGMTRGGQPYFVKGAGGGGNLRELAARGANSLRTWTTGGLQEILDEAQSLGMTVSAGIWLEHECSWFSYSNPEHCDKQAERVRGEVLQFRDHPALLAWGIGNEVEGDGSDVAFWRQIDRLARLVKELDPAHPTYTALAGANENKVKGLMEHAPNLDFVGINTYAGIHGLRNHLDKLGWKKPWMLTEWGPRGFWESPKHPSGAPVEQTSTEKAEMIGNAYRKVISNQGGCLGSYVFLWGWKFEATATWFGLLTHEGETTAAVDTLQEVWSNTEPANRAPSIEKIRGVPGPAIAPGSTFTAETQAKDPEGDPLEFRWLLLPEHTGHHTHKWTKLPKDVPGALSGEPGNRVTVTAPAKPGVYRLYVWVRDGKGHAATATAPFAVK